MRRLWRFCFATFAACLPSAVRVRFERWLIVFFFLATDAAFFTLRRAAKTCLRDAIRTPYFYVADGYAIVQAF